MTNYPPPAEELRLVDRELGMLDARRAVLLQRRAWLLNVLRAAAPVPPPARTGPPSGWRAPGPDTGARGVQNLLLVLGGLLLAVAAVAFTLLSWGRMGITGRSLVLGAVTAAALAVPLVALRRGLRSTAEAIAGTGLVLTVLDAYAVHRVALPELGATAYTAVAAAVLATGWAGYGLGVRALRLPVPAAVLAAQPVLFLWAVAAGAEVPVLAAALLVTSAGDTVLALRAPGRAVRITAAVTAGVAGSAAVLASLWQVGSADSWADSLVGAALLAATAALAVAAARAVASTGLALALSLTGGLLAVAALGVVPARFLPDAWVLPGYLSVALVLGAAALLPEPSRWPAGPVRRGALLAAGVVQTAGLLWAGPVVALGVVGPLRQWGAVWSGTPEHLPSSAGAAGLPEPLAATVVLGVLAAVAYGLAVLRERGGVPDPRLRLAVVVLGWAGAVSLPLALRLPYAAALTAYGVLVAVLVAQGCRRGGTAPGSATPGEEGGPAALPHPALPLALLTSFSTTSLALATQTATLVVLGALCALSGGAGRALRGSRVPLAAPVAAVVCLGYATGLLGAVGAALDLGHPGTALLVLTVPTVTVLLAAWLGDDPLTRAVEGGGVPAAVVAVLLAVPDAAALSLVLGLCGGLAAVTALRADRRAAGYVAATLFVLSAWARLLGWEVTAPEAYALPVTVLALAVGVLRRRGRPLTSSWTAYGPGLAVTLLPSLMAAWSDTGWVRPLLLGAGALGVTLVGARHRLQAPLVLGGTVVALVALHELAPYVAQVAGALPRWLPPALAGLLLLTVGATYEHRLRDVRRFRTALGRLR
ncbi:SCO7613 C-terminal domain-containing membrane protein [Streptomyces sp. NPDC127068]|uniref:SCO7613 C-terminal domain-containing membrane protein n=1 Tax=Streptomyces sp. NPDC127068 TaxID=3347127 RepID=UPI00365482A8